MPGERWWMAFDDPVLDSLVADALAANNDLAAGVQRVTQARAQLRVAGSALSPQAGGSGSLSRDYTARSGSSSTSTAGSRPEGRPVGREGVGPCRCRWSRSH